MEEKKVFKISLFSVILLVLNVIFIIVVIIMGNEIIKLKEEKKNYISEQSSVKKEEFINQNQEDNSNNNDIIDNNIIDNSINNIVTGSMNNTVPQSNQANNIQYVNKIVENRPYIYDAQYSKGSITNNSYTANDGNNYSISDIVVPYINMNSNDATNMNLEIENLYKSYLDEFVKCSQNQNSFIKVNYNSYITSNIYSILITIQRGQESNITENYIAYNFDSVSGTKLTYDQVYGIAGITDIENSIMNTINNLDEYNNYDLSKKRDISQKQIEEMNTKVKDSKNQSFSYYQQELTNNKLVYFLDNNLKLNIVINVILPDIDVNTSKIVIIEN